MDVVWSVLESLHFEKTTFFCQTILFFVLHYALKFLVYGPIMEIRNRRDSRIAADLAAAEAATAEARQLKSDYEEKVRAARAEGQSAIVVATDAAESDRKQRVESARDKASEILKAAREEAQAAMAKAEETVEAQSDAVASAIASKLLKSSLGKDAKAVVAKLGGAS